MDIEIEHEIFIGAVKREPSIEHLLILPPASEDGSAAVDEPAPGLQAEEDVAPKRQRSKKSASSSKLLNCNKCSYKTFRKDHLMSHKGTHNKSFECKTCRKKFSIHNSLKNHQMQHKHGIFATTVEMFGCDKCAKSFSTSIYLKKHQGRVHDDREAKCAVCEKVCKNRTSLSNHKRYAHSIRHHFECDFCDYKGKLKQNLAGHINSKHRTASKRSTGCGKVLSNAKQAPSSDLPEPVPDPVPLPPATNGPFMGSFVDRIDNFPPLVQRHFQREMRTFFDDFISQNFE